MHAILGSERFMHPGRGHARARTSGIFTNDCGSHPPPPRRAAGQPSLDVFSSRSRHHHHPGKQPSFPARPSPPSQSLSFNMAQYLASIYGTEQDKVNCSFYYKVRGYRRLAGARARVSCASLTSVHFFGAAQIGACRHGDRCSRKHTKPPFSQTILIANVYQNPRHADPDCKLTDEELQAQFDDFFEDFFW